ncbi:MAG TPA: NAD(P)/FAD-dependent oxidoreductase [Gemmatimonadaceae bacterium]|nr:NAD(P)/FAD-dependent oxidoreductase [Gemmatimonadaceae bacterium]
MFDETYHAIVIGGSFAGLAAAIQLGRARRRVLVVDAGKPRNRFAHSSHGFLGQDGRSPAEILDTFRAQVLAYPTVRFESGEVVDAYRGGDDDFTVTLASGDNLRSQRLILATGVVDELPSIPGLQERWGVTVAHCPYCHGYEVRDRRLGVLAGSEMAIQHAVLVRDWSADVTIFTNGAFEPDADQRSALAARGIRVEERAVEALVGTVPELAGVRLRDGNVVEIDALFTSTRTRMSSPLAERLGCAFDEGPFGPVVRTDARKETTVTGVYCAGDAARTPHNTTWAAADGATAGVMAHQSLVFAPAFAR